MTDESEKSAEESATVEPGTLVRVAGGGMLRHGSKKGNKGGTGRPRNELRDMLRGFAFQKFPKFRAKWDSLTEDQQIRALDLALKYGLGTQTEAVTPDEMKDAAKRIVGEVVTILLDEEHWPMDKVQAVAARITRAAEGNNSPKER